MIKAILACDMMMGIGNDGTLPWPHNSEDLKHFKKLTDNNVVVMGSKTWDDPKFPGPLKNRLNIVVTSKTKGYYGAIKINDPLETIELLANYLHLEKDIWIIGGATIYKLFKDLINEWHVTIVQDVYDCDTFIEFPENLTMVSCENLGSNKYVVLKKEKNESVS